MKFKQIRKSAFETWIDGTKHIRANKTDNLEKSYEYTWQNEYKDPEKDECDHKSIFCSLGEWNSIITDYLTDERWDDLKFENPEHSDQIFRLFYYKRHKERARRTNRAGYQNAIDISGSD